jgi:DNA gyrase subunit A
LVSSAKRRASTETLLKSPSKRWAVIREELTTIKASYADKRRTKVGVSAAEPEFQESDFIIDEDANVVLSTQGWVKRVKEVKDLSTTRLRDGDSVLAVTAGSTRASLAFFSNLGSCYVVRIADIPSSTGYGDPVQKLFKLADGEKMVAMLGFDARVLEVPEASGEEPEEPFAVAVTRGGLGLRFSLRPHGQPSTRAGRRAPERERRDHASPSSRRRKTSWSPSPTTVTCWPSPRPTALLRAGKGTMVIARRRRAAGRRAARRRRRGDVVFVTGKGKTSLSRPPVQGRTRRQERRGLQAGQAGVCHATPNANLKPEEDA